jgi:hypothetical protein
MVKIDNKIKEVINHIKMAEAKEASHISKIEDAAPSSFSSYLIETLLNRWKRQLHYKLSCTLLKITIYFSHYTLITKSKYRRV